MLRWRHSITELLNQPFARGLASERGNASLEFITLGVLLLVPVVYLVVTVAAIQGSAFAVEGAARQAVRVYVQSETPEQAAARAELAVRFALADAGIDDLEPEVMITCSPHPDACLTRRGTVTISVFLTVPLPLVPAALDLMVPVGVPLQAAATEQVSRFWGAG